MEWSRSATNGMFIEPSPPCFLGVLILLETSKWCHNKNKSLSPPPNHSQPLNSLIFLYINTQCFDRAKQYNNILYTHDELKSRMCLEQGNKVVIKGVFVSFILFTDTIYILISQIMCGANLWQSLCTFSQILLNLILVNVKNNAVSIMAHYN